MIPYDNTTNNSPETLENSSSKKDIINNDEKHINCTIPLEQIKLTTHPLDDYQRTLFSLFFAKASLKPDNNEGKFDVEIKKVEYKSNLVEKLTDLHTLIFSDEIKTEQAIKPNRITKIKSKDKTARKTRKKLKNMLYGLMYSFPDFNILPNASDLPNDRKSKSVLKLTDTITEKFSIDSTQYPQIFDIDITTNDNTNNDSTILTDNTLINDGSRYSIVQNQIFKKENDLHFEYNQYHIFNRNNSVIWSPNRKFVFVTGIWKLYQDVMYGLSNIGRLNKQNDLTQQDCCEIEFQTVLDDLFPNLPSRFSHNIKRRRSSAESVSSKSTVSTENTDESSKPASKYVEFHWDKIRNSIRKNLLHRYRNYLIQDKQIDPAILRDIEKLPFIQKVRGGYIHIQGTWLPIELTRSLCVTFAFPIRYLLIPLFGSEFPKECEEWYENREQNMSELKEMPLNVVYNKIDAKTGTELLTPANEFIETGSHSVHQVNRNKDTSLSPKRKKVRKTTTTTSPFDTYQRPSFNGQLLHASNAPASHRLPGIQSFSNEVNHNIEKNNYYARKTIQADDNKYLKKDSALCFLLNPTRPQINGNQHLNSINTAGTTAYSQQNSPLLPNLNRDGTQLLGSNQHLTQIIQANNPVYVPVLQANIPYGHTYTGNQNSTPLRHPTVFPGPSFAPVNSTMRPDLLPLGNNTMNNYSGNIPPPLYSTTPANSSNNIPLQHAGPVYGPQSHIQLSGGPQHHHPIPSTRGGNSWAPTVCPYPPTQHFQRPFLYEDSTTRNHPGNARLVSPSVVVYPSLSPKRIDQSASPVAVNNQASFIPNNDARPETKQ